MRENGRSERPKNGADAQPCLSDVYKNGTRAKRRQVDAPLCGRSMVEMLGVLAIIGVLSIGAMSGYSQAMFKYKLNKHTSQIGYIIDYIIANQGWLRSASYQLQGILNKMDVVPDDMIKDNSKYVYDVFSSRIKLENHTNEGEGFAIGVEINNNKHAIEICRNFIIMAKERADDVSAVYIQREELDGSYSGMSRYYGNKIKGQSNYLHNLDVIKMDNACKVCDETMSCFIFILIGYDF